MKAYRMGAALWAAGALFALGCGTSEKDAVPEETSTARQRVTAAATETLTLTLDPGVPLQEIAFSGTEEVRVGGRTQMSVAGDGAGYLVNTGTGSVHVQSDAQIFGLRGQGDVRLDDRGRVEGDVVASGSVTQGNQVVVTGAIEANASLPRPALAERTVEFLGGDDVLRGPDAPALTLPPGAHGHVSLQSRSTLVLGAPAEGASSWYLESLAVEPEAVLRVETTPGRPTLLFVRQRFDFKGTFELVGSPEDLFVVLTTSERVSIERQIDGTIFAPKAAVRLAPAHRTFTGAIWAKSLEIEPDLTLQFVPFAHWERVYPQLFMIPGDRPSLPNALAQARVPAPGTAPVGAPAGQSKFRMLDPSGYVPAAPPAALTAPDPDFRVHFTRIRVGEDGWACGSSVEPSLVDLEINGVRLPRRDLADCHQHSWCDIDVELSTPVPADQQLVKVSAAILERDRIGCGGSDKEWSVSFDVDNWDGSTVRGEATRHRDNPGRDLFGPVGPGEVCHTFRGWGLCWEAEITGPPEPEVEDVEVPVCASFVAEYLDTGLGEDRLVPDVVEPARYAWGKLLIDGKVRYEGFLDENGCVPDGHRPRRPELVHDAARTDYVVLEYSPVFCLNSTTATTKDECMAEATAAAAGTIAERAGGTASWRVIYVDPAYLSAKVEGGVRAPHVIDVKAKQAHLFHHRFQGVVHPNGFWLEQHGYRYPDPNATVVGLWDDPSDEQQRISSRVAAAVSTLVGTPDNGILGGNYLLMANDSCPRSSFDIIGDACVADGYLWLGPGRDMLEGRTTYDQTFWKGVILHEAGHLVQAKAVGRMGKTVTGFDGMYAFTKEGGAPSSSTDLDVVHADPPGTPDMCGCSQVEAANKLHCMQSLERYGEAHGEGFAQFYAARTLNNHGENDCIFPYYKETVLETCTSGDCDPWAGGLQKNKPPVPFDCIEPVQWRNRHCPELAGGRTNEDRSTEVDWMKFLYSLNTQADHKWTMIDLWRLYEVMPSHSAACAGHESSQFCWGSVRDAATEVGGDNQAAEVRDRGLAYGIDENLSMSDAP